LPKIRCVRNLDQTQLCPEGSSVTIGNFDGLHLGHQALIKQTNKMAAAESLVPAALTFNPTAREFFNPQSAPARVYSLSERIALMRHYGLELVWCLRFNQALAQMNAEEFVQRILFRGLNARHICVGEDFRFGQGRQGDVDLLHRMGQRLGFMLSLAETVKVGQHRVSSTVLRERLWEGDFAQVEQLLGRSYEMSGKVVRGQQLGRQLGYPTANIRLHRMRSPLHGIYAVRVDGPGISHHAAVASVGSRPTVNGKGMLLEVHLFDFDRDIYGQRLSVRFYSKLRDEEKFDDLESLTRQMDLDAQQARALLRT